MTGNAPWNAAEIGLQIKIGVERWKKIFMMGRLLEWSLEEQQRQVDEYRNIDSLGHRYKI